jgi:hypothetical protein
LANRYISTLDALLAGGPSSGIGRHLASSLTGSGSADRSSPSASAAATAAAAAAAAVAADPATAGSLGGLYGSLGLASAALEAQIKRTLHGQAARAEAAEVRSLSPSHSKQPMCMIPTTRLNFPSSSSRCKCGPRGTTCTKQPCLVVLVLDCFKPAHRLRWRLRC